MDDIDFKKLAVQEPDFASFAKNAVFESYIVTKSGRELLKVIYNLYQVGMTEKQVTQFMANAMRQNGKDFQKFISYCLHWQDELGLKDWHLYFYHKNIGDAFAQTECSPSGRGVSIRLSTNWPDRPTSDYELKQCALHEVLHIVTAEMMNEARSRFADEYNLEAAEHSVVTRMTNYIMRLQNDL